MLRDELQAAMLLFQRLEHTQMPPEEPRLADVVREIENRLATGQYRSLSRQDLDELRERLASAAKRNAFEEISARDWKRAPEVFWIGRPPLAAHKGLVTAYCHHIGTSKRSSLLRRLIAVYFRVYPKGMPGLKRLSSQLVASLQDHKDERTLLWKRRHTELALFTPGKGPKNVAQRCLESAQPFEQTLTETGFPTSLWQTSFIRAVNQHLGHFIHQRMVQEEAQELRPILERFLAWQTDGDALRFPDQQAKLADALLCPYLETPKAGHEMKPRIQQFLLRFLKDPRFHGAQWQGVSREQKRMFIGWLISGTLDDFFCILDEVALDHHWRYRRSFWRAYLSQGALDDAWVALGPNVQQHAKRLPLTNGYARLEGGNDRNQCVLLLRIGRLTIGEWSHNGKCRLWSANDHLAPKLYEPQYNGREMKSNGFSAAEFSHLGSENGRWQDKVADLIHSKTGLHVLRQLYMRLD